MKDSSHGHDSAGPYPKNSATPQDDPEPKFQVGQVVIMAGDKGLPVRILDRAFHDGWFYRWTHRNYAAEHLLRELDDLEKGVMPTK